MAVLRVAHVWGDRLLDVRHLAGDGTYGALTRSHGRIRVADEAIWVDPLKPTFVSLGATSLRLEYVEPLPRLPALAEDSDWHFAKLLGCLLVAGAALIAIFILDVQLGFADDDSQSLVPVSYRRTLVAPRPSQPRPALVAAATPAAKAQKPQPPAQGPSRSEPKSAGLLGMFDLDGVKALFTPGLSPGLNAAIDGLKGQRQADWAGVGGPRGTSLGTGGLDLGPGGDGLTLRRSAGGGGVLRKKLDVGPCCAQTQVTDGLSKELIAGVIRRHFSEIKFCYDRALQHDSKLEGKVVVLFTIDSSGAVSDAAVAESTLNDEAVEACVLSRVRRWKFPEPQGGGVVSVTHPWLFRPAGSAD